MLEEEFKQGIQKDREATKKYEKVKALAAAKEQKEMEKQNKALAKESKEISKSIRAMKDKCKSFLKSIYLEDYHLQMGKKSCTTENLEHKTHPTIKLIRDLQHSLDKMQERQYLIGTALNSK